MQNIDKALHERFAQALANHEGRGADFAACRVDPVREEEEGRYEGYLSDIGFIMVHAGLPEHLEALHDKIRHLEADLLVSRQALDAIGELSVMDYVVTSASTQVVGRFAEIHQHASAELAPRAVAQAYRREDINTLTQAAQVRNWGVVNCIPQDYAATHRVIGFMIPKEEISPYAGIGDVIGELDGRFDHLGREVQLIDVTAQGSFQAVTEELLRLEEVAATYANDEDRYLKQGGEPYGAIPTEIGLAARAARARHMARNIAQGGCVRATKPFADSLSEPVSLSFGYTNWRDEYANRSVVPIGLWRGNSKFHKGTQWFLSAFDTRSGEQRDFAFDDIVGGNAEDRRQHVLKGRVEPIREALLDAYFALYGKVEHSTGIAGKINEAVKALDSIEEVTLSPSMAAAFAERNRQVTDEGWSLEHDDSHSHGEMSYAAASYAICAAHQTAGVRNALDLPDIFPWDKTWWKPQAARRNLEKSIALGLAEVDRINRQRQLLISVLPEVLHRPITVAEPSVLVDRLRVIGNTLVAAAKAKSEEDRPLIALLATHIDYLCCALGDGAPGAMDPGNLQEFSARDGASALVGNVLKVLDAAEINSSISDLPTHLRTAIEIIDTMGVK